MSRTRIPKTTIVDIAAAAGVSVTTVSRIINDRPDVADQTRQRVLRVMDEIGFAPQSAWRQIRSGRTGLIAVHVPTEFNPPGYRLIMAAALGVEDAGYLINIITRPLSDAELLELFRSRQVDGIILLEDRDWRIAGPKYCATTVSPSSMIGHRTDNDGLSFVDLDVEAGIDTAFEHLVSVGHRQIALVIAPPVVQDRTYGFAAWALRAYERACARHGLPNLARLGTAGEPLPSTALRLLDEHPETTGCIAPQEDSVIAVLKAAQDCAGFASRTTCPWSACSRSQWATLARRPSPRWASRPTR